MNVTTPITNLIQHMPDGLEQWVEFYSQVTRVQHAWDTSTSHDPAAGRSIRFFKAVLGTQTTVQMYARRTWIWAREQWTVLASGKGHGWDLEVPQTLNRYAAWDSFCDFKRVVKESEVWRRYGSG
jgi:hypothetical protein